MDERVKFIRRIVPETSTSFIVPAAPSDIPSVLLLHCDGVDGSNSFPDSSTLGGHTVTANGGVQVDTANFKFGTGSALFVGASATDYLSLDGSTDFAFGSGAFTVDFQLYLASIPAIAEFFWDFGINVASDPISLYMFNDHHLYLRYQAGSDVISGTATLATGQWYHIAITGDGSRQVRLFVDGNQDGSTWDATGLGDFNTAANYPVIGRRGDVADRWFDGWIDEFRVIKGTAAWTSAFTPPSAPYNA